MDSTGSVEPTSHTTDNSAEPTTQDPLLSNGHLKGDAAISQTDCVSFSGDNDDVRLEVDAQKLAELDSDSEDARGNWGGKLEFLFTCIGYAVGLGNVWRFPYLCYKNGGGAFLLPYVIMLAAVGLPLFFMELAFGQFASLGPISVWKINPLFKGLGFAMVAVSWLIAVYYNVIISHVLLYLFASFRSVTGNLPWISCNNTWNTPDCLPPRYHDDTQAYASNGNASVASYITTTAASVLSNATKLRLGRLKTPAEEYYNNYVLEMSSGMEEMGAVNWKLALCLLFAWFIIFICLIRGIQSLGKVVYFTAIFPYIMLTILLLRGASLPGAIDGVIFYLKPDFSRLTDARVWSDAATQIFYSLSACSGGLIAMASYNKFDNNCLKDSLIVALINCATSIYAGFVIFCVLGFMAYEKGVSVAEVAAGGPGLAFVVYPEALSRMPVPQLWAIFFFIMMATLGFGSQFSIVECVLSAFTDEFPDYLRGKRESIIFRSVVMFATFLLGLPMVTKGGIYLLNLVDYSVSGFPLLFVGLLECVALNWIYGYDKFADDISLMLGHAPNNYWKICWKFVSPIVIIVTIIFNIILYTPPTLGDYHYSTSAQVLGWFIQLFPMSLMVGMFLYHYCKDGGFQLVVTLMREKPGWGPSHPSDRSRSRRYSDAALKRAASASGLPNGRPHVFGSSVRLLNNTPSASGSATPIVDRRTETPSRNNSTVFMLGDELNANVRYPAVYSSKHSLSSSKHSVATGSETCV